MGRAIPVVTARFRWASRDKAEAAFRSILREHGYLAGDRVTDPGDVAMIEDLLAIHPHATDKVGCGVSHFEVRQLAGTAGQNVATDDVALWIVRHDGTEVEFSYREAIRPSDPRRQVTTALRAAVDDLRRAYRQRRFDEGTATSDISGVVFNRRADAHVIYDTPTFAQLTFRFAAGEGGWAAIQLGDVSSSAYVGDRLGDASVELRWRDFYSQHARPLLATKTESARRPRSNEEDWSP